MTTQPENLEAVRAKKIKMCQFPSCKNRGASIGRKNVRRRWCVSHLKGAGKKEREKYSNSLLVGGEK